MPRKPYAVLNNREVQELRECIRTGMSPAAAALAFGITRQCAWKKTRDLVAVSKAARAERSRKRDRDMIAASSVDWADGDQLAARFGLANRDCFWDALCRARRRQGLPRIKRTYNSLGPGRTEPKSRRRAPVDHEARP